MTTHRLCAPLVSLAAACLCTLLACTADDGGDTGGSASTTVSDTDPAATTDSTGAVGTSTGDGSTTAVATSDAPTTSDGGSTAASAGESTAAESTGPAPTDGPGVLPGETGLDAFCRRYVECGGTFYADAQACIDESLGYWGECASRRAALDDFGACMSELSCRSWSPDAYNPASTPCADQWDALGASAACN
jgi:hypothetical protein